MSKHKGDSAKREIPSDNVAELKKLKAKYDIRDEKGRHIRPLFFKYIDGYKGYNNDYYVYVDTPDEGFVKELVTDKYSKAKAIRDANPEKVKIERGRMSYSEMKTSMDYLEKAVDNFKHKRKKRDYLPFSEMLIPADQLSGQVYYPQIHRIVAMVEKAKTQIAELYTIPELTKSEIAIETQIIKSDLSERINSVSINEKGIRYILSLLDDKRYSGISKYLFDIVFNTNHDKFYDLVEQSKTPVKKLEECEDGDIDILGIKYRKIQTVNYY